MERKKRERQKGRRQECWLEFLFRNYSYTVVQHKCKLILNLWFLFMSILRPIVTFAQIVSVDLFLLSLHFISNFTFCLTCCYEKAKGLRSIMQLKRVVCPHLQIRSKLILIKPKRERCFTLPGNIPCPQPGKLGKIFLP